jgi:uncharacterized protein (TIGR02594 family)
MAFVTARSGAPKTVIYSAADGTETVREGGSRSCWNFNPGNIERGSFADEYGAIGGDTRFAIFPDETVGRDAIVGLLQSPGYRNLTLEAAVNRYAPPHENNTAGYVAFVAIETGLAPQQILSALPITKLRSVAAAIKKIEGWIPGVERPNLPLATLAGTMPEALSSAAVAADDWLDIARSEADRPPSERSEWTDPGENPRILNYFRVASPWFDPATDGGDESNWCAAFVNYCLETAGYRGTGHPGARSFFWNRGTPFLKLAQPARGCIAVLRDKPFTDPKWQHGSGHVGFVVDWTDTRLELLGGNQGKTVRRLWYDRETRNNAGQVTRRLEALLVPVMN